MSNFFRRHLPFLNTDDSFFVVEILGDTLRCSQLLVAKESKQARVVQVEETVLADHTPESFTRVLMEQKKKFQLPVDVRSIAMLDYRRAAVMSESVTLMRSDPKAEIKQAELENLISQGLWKLLAAHRGAAATKMGIADTRVRLADADVLRVRLNNHRVVNPIGFLAKAIEISYQETFIDQSVLHALHAELTEDNLTAIVEAPAVLAGIVGRMNPNSSFLFVDVGATESVVYMVNQMILTYMDSFGWGADTLLNSVAKQFGVDATGGAAIISRYGKREVSPLMRRAIERAASGELAILSNGIAAHQPTDMVLPVYIHAAIPLPEIVFDPAFAGRLGLNLMLTAVNERFIGEHTGCVVHYNETQVQASRFSFDAVAAVIADVYRSASMPLMSKTAKQRARWIQNPQ